jgi:peptide chain release factor 2
MKSGPSWTVSSACSPACRSIFDLDRKRERLAQLETRQAEAGFWDKPDEAAVISREVSNLSLQLSDYAVAQQAASDARTMWELLQEQADSLSPEELQSLEDEVLRAAGLLERLELEALLDGEYDDQPAIVSIQAGAGGRESCDWAEMLYRMYKMFADRQGWKVEVTDETEGEVAGIQSLTCRIDGRHAYGFMKVEHGVHRLVRISPFDKTARRHTSFASVSVVPEVPADLELEVKDEDVKMDVFRSSGAGGQHVNKTSSAVRLTHLPTGLVVTCQDQRSQHQNRDYAMRELKSRLLGLMLEQHKERIEDLRGVQSEIAWGSQIRNYVLQPYQMVKDLRSACETSDAQGVLNGALEPFIWAGLRWLRSQRTAPDAASS